MAWLQGLSVSCLLMAGFAFPRSYRAEAGNPLWNHYRCADGKWLSVGAIEPAFYANLCRALGCERFVGNQNDDALQEEIRAAFREAFERRTRDEWIAELAPNDTCVAPVYTMSEIANDAHLRTRGVFATAHEAEHGAFEQVGAVLAGGPRDVPVHEVRDADRTDTTELLAAAGLGADEIGALRSAGAIE